MTNKTKLVRAGVTGVTGIVSAGAVALGIVALVTLPIPGFVGTPPALSIAPVPAVQQRVCPGPLVEVLSQGTADITFISNGQPEYAQASSEDNFDNSWLNAPDNQSGVVYGAPQVISVPPAASAEQAPLLAGNQEQLLATESLSGLAAAACTEPANDLWLVGGSTEVGRTTLVMLANPTDVTATVTLEVFTENGYVEAANSDGIIVEPGEQRIVSLAGYAPDVYSPVVRVMSNGGQVLASLQQSVTRTLVPSGVEWVVPGAGLATQQIITGVFVTGQADHERSEIGDVISDLDPGIRVVAPGDKDSKVTVTLLSSTGEKTEYSAQLKAKKAVQLPLTGIADGTYTVIVTSEQPIAAGVRTVQDSLTDATAAPGTPITGGDFAWMSSSSFLTDEILIPIPQGTAPTVTFYNPGRDTAEVTLSAQGQKDIVLSVKKGEMVTSPLMAATNYPVTGATGLLGGLSFSGPGLGSAIALNPANVLGSPITVYPR